MSLEKDITTLKQILEDEQVFKPASREQLKQRQAAIGGLWMNIRVIRGNSEEEAVEAIQDGAFEESHPLCDVVIPASDMKIKNAWLTNGGTSWVAADQITVNEAEQVFKPADKEELKRRKDKREAELAGIPLLPVDPEATRLDGRYWKACGDLENRLRVLRSIYEVNDKCECDPDAIDAHGEDMMYTAMPGEHGSNEHYCLRCGGYVEIN